MKQIILVISIIFISISANSQDYTHTSNSGCYGEQIGEGDELSEEHLINVPGAESIRLSLYALILEYGWAEIEVLDQSGNILSIISIFSEDDWVDEEKIIVVPNPVTINLSCIDNALVDFCYEAGSDNSATFDLVSMERNILFNADDRYTISGYSSFNLDAFFDGKMSNVEKSTGNTSLYYDINVSGLNIDPTNGKSYIGFLSEGNPPKDFEIKANNSTVLTTVMNNSSLSYFVELTEATSSLQIRIYELSSSSTSGISEIVLISESGSFYEGLFLPQTPDDITMTGTIYQPTETGIKISDISDKLVFKASTTQTEIHAAGTGGTVIKGDANDALVLIDDAGNVGIGTLTPAAKLAVDGIVLAEEVVVTADVNSYPDFVFEEDYDLISLEELAVYIYEYGHLPDIPKVEEAVTEGIKVAEMNQLLLQKIEELTLYMIQANERIIRLEEENRILNNHSVQSE